GWEKTRIFTIADVDGEQFGWLIEDNNPSFNVAMGLQLLKIHRPFKARVEGMDGNVVLRIIRPFTWVNSIIYVDNMEGQRIGSVQSKFHAWKRSYDLYIGKDRFSKIRGGALAWDFSLQNREGQLIGHIGCSFRGITREALMDTGRYILEMESVQDPETARFYPLTISERAGMLATAICIDFEYFS
ncbi:Scramblase, partial [Piptocephalis cylindrospora]